MGWLESSCRHGKSAAGIINGKDKVRLKKKQRLLNYKRGNKQLGTWFCILVSTLGSFLSIAWDVNFAALVWLAFVGQLQKGIKIILFKAEMLNNSNLDACY